MLNDRLTEEAVYPATADAIAELAEARRLAALIDVAEQIAFETEDRRRSNQILDHVITASERLADGLMQLRERG